jgi:hypothetical protein
MTSPEVQVVSNFPRLRKRLLVLAGALALGGVAYVAMGHYLESLQALAQYDKLAARAKLATLIRAMALGLFPMTGAIGVVIVNTCRQSFAAGRFPPPGSRVFPAARSFTGVAARRLAFAMLVLGIALVLCSVAAAALSWVMADQLLACRA